MPLKITSKRPGFRRAGVAHAGTPVVWPDGVFTPEQVAALKAEPMLIVDEIPEAQPEAKPEGKGK